jgi:hypothetical protein
MSAPVDISAERCGLIAGSVNEATFELILALRAALDAAERERDAYRSSEAEVLAENDALRFTLNNARLDDATGYARGVKDAAGLFENAQSKSWMGVSIVIAILALLPDATKEAGDDQ